MTLFGHLSTWLLVGLTWITLSIIVGLAVGLVARMGKGKEKGK